MNQRQLPWPGGPQELVVHFVAHFLGLRYNQWDPFTHRPGHTWSTSAPQTSLGSFEDQRLKQKRPSYARTLHFLKFSNINDLI